MGTPSRLGNTRLEINLLCIVWWVVAEWADRPELPFEHYHHQPPAAIGVFILAYTLMATPT